MAGIVELNSPGVAWRHMEDRIRGIVRDLGYGSEVADWVVADIKQRKLQLQHVTPSNWDNIPAEVRPLLPKVLEGFKEAYIGVMISWLTEVVKIECELWVAKFAAK
jgi:hypothetical protein